MVKQYPFYLRTTVILVGFVVLTHILSALREILVPLSFALLLAILMNPLVSFLEKRRLPKVPAIIITIIVAIIFFGGIGYFVVLEMRGFAGDLPEFKQKALHLFADLQHYARHDFGINTARQNRYLDQVQESLKPVLATAMGSILGVLAMLVLLPVYTFLFLFYKDLIVGFLYDVFARADKKDVTAILSQTKISIERYVVGLLVEAVIVAILNTAALLILDVPYAVLLGVLGAMVNVLPFLGGILGVLFPVLVATVTKDGFQTQLWILVLYGVIQFVDNHFLVPYVVAAKVRINALISIVIVLLGGALWGISGMFLSIPFVGVLKIIFDRIPEMQPWGRLIGTDRPVAAAVPWKRSRKKTIAR